MKVSKQLRWNGMREPKAMVLSRGKVNYFRMASATENMTDLDGWFGRKLRCLKLKQCKRASAIGKFLPERGVPRDAAARISWSGKGLWRKSMTRQTHEAMGIKWFKELGLLSFVERYEDQKLA